LLSTFAYLPTITTVINSLFLPGFRGEPTAFVGLDNYRVLLDDPTFWKVARNNLLYALGTIPTSIALALGMADVVQAQSGGIHLDAIFVDEGFGALDPGALDVAINTLSDLQEGGRTVGVISHLDEIKQRITTGLEVVKTDRGSHIVPGRE
jgi:DNA repair exonuclease SbcCD ATPase subunit